jgi:hypothetical protein
MRGKALLIGTLVTAASLVASPGTAAPDDDDEKQFARGHVDIRFSMGVNVIEKYKFVAHRKSTGSFGHFKFDSERDGAEVEASGQVICLTVIGNRARLGGQVTRSDFEGIPVGTQLVWSVANNDGKKNDGSDEDDTASSLLGGVDAMAYCAGGLPFPEFPVRKGNIEVRP